MYESDTCTKLAAAFIILDFCDQLLDQEKKNKDANKLLVSRFFLVYIVIFSCKSLYRAVCNTVVRDDQVSIIWTLKQSYLAHRDSHMLNMHCFVYSGVNTKGG